MADFNALETLINAYIKQNGVQAITGQVLNGVLRGMVSALGKGWTIAGDAEPTTDPGTMTGPVAYIAHTAGTYAHFGDLVVNDGEVAFLKYNEQTWTKEVLASMAATASVDANVGTPSVGVSFVNGVLNFDFHNMKGNPGINGTDGQDGAAAGFGTVSASVDNTVGTPAVSVQSSGPNTAKNFAFSFTGLKGETGVTSVVVTVDNTSGNPQCTASLNAGVLTLAFTGLKGAQGDTGSSVDYPFTLVNNLTTDDATQALTAAMGVQLESEITQLEHIVSNLSGRFYGVFDDDSDLPEGTGIGYAFVGTDEPLALFTLDGEDWTDTEVAISGIVGPPGEPGIQGIQGIPGPPGVTSVVASADANVGVPSVDVSLNNGVLTFTFHNIKGAQGNTGSSVAYPFTLVNNLVTDDATQALTSAMGYLLGIEVFGPMVDVTEVDQHDGYYVNKDTGELVAGSNTSIVRDYNIDPGKKYYATGKHGANLATCLACYYDKEWTFISSQFPSDGSSVSFDHQELSVPSNCAFIRIFGSTPSPMPKLTVVYGSLNQRLSKVENEMGSFTLIADYTQYGDGINAPGYYINKDTGVLTEGDVRSIVREYNIDDATLSYYATGRTGLRTTTCLAAFYQQDGTFISSQYPARDTSKMYDKAILAVPSNCRMIRVFGSTLLPLPELYFGQRLPDKVDYLEESLNGLKDDLKDKNTGKTIGVFGGSLSVRTESQTAKDIWRKKLGVTVTDYGVAGAGFSSLQGTSIQEQVDGAASKDVYILWASTNDYRNNRECGVWSDYTAEDNYDSSKLVTQCGGINYCIKKLLTINPNAEIYFFTPVRFFSMESGYNPFSEETNTTGKTFAEYIAEMKKCCDYYGIPVLDQFDLQGVNIFNKSLYYASDNLHMNEAGYEKIGWVQADFLANGE